MAATAHSDPYGIFMRKIGYSVGLESTFKRLGDLQELYLSNGDVTLASWKELVRGERGWKLKTENIADVFYSLRVIHCTSGDVLILENLDAIAITDRLLDDEGQKRAAKQFVFLWSVLVNDGELFVNMLLAGFDEQLIRDRLSEMIRHKRKVLAKSLPGRDAMKRIERVVAIERQESNTGSLGLGRSVASLKRTEPLQRKRSLQSESSLSEATRFSSDYFRKVPPRRKDWARTLGLWSDDAGLTSLGHSLCNSLRSSGYIGEKGIFTFWPMDYELVRSGFRSNLLRGTKTLWEALTDFGTAYAGVQVRRFAPADANALVRHLGNVMRVYRSLHTRKAMLRRELAIGVAYPTAVAIASAKGNSVLDLPAALRYEQTSEKRRITFRRSRNIGGTLRLKV